MDEVARLLLKHKVMDYVNSQSIDQRYQRKLISLFGEYSHQSTRVLRNEHIRDNGKKDLVHLVGLDGFDAFVELFVETTDVRISEIKISVSQRVVAEGGERVLFGNALAVSLAELDAVVVHQEDVQTCQHQLNQDLLVHVAVEQSRLTVKLKMYLEDELVEDVRDLLSRDPTDRGHEEDEQLEGDEFDV